MKRIIIIKLLVVQWLNLGIVQSLLVHPPGVYWVPAMKKPSSWHPGVDGSLDNSLYSVGGSPAYEKGYSEQVDVYQQEQEVW